MLKKHLPEGLAPTSAHFVAAMAISLVCAAVAVLLGESMSSGDVPILGVLLFVYFDLSDRLGLRHD